jgi:hypothetical protein
MSMKKKKKKKKKKNSHLDDALVAVETRVYSDKAGALPSVNDKKSKIQNNKENPFKLIIFLKKNEFFCY